MAVVAKYDGIDGEAVDDNHRKWIDVLSIGALTRRAVARRARAVGAKRLLSTI